LAPESDEEKEVEKAKKEKKEVKKEDAPVQVKVDLEDIDQRILALPVPARNYFGLLAGKAGNLFLAEGPPGSQSTRQTQGGLGLIVHRFDLKKRKLDKRLEGVSSLAISANGEKLLYRQGQAWHIVPAQPPGGDADGPGGQGRAAAAALARAARGEAG